MPIVTYSRKVFIPLTNLCRDECGYCVYAKPPADPSAGYLKPEEVLEIAREGERLGCKEALFSFGERPELKYPEARDALARLGYGTTLEYARAMAERVLEETGLLPHVNAGTLTEDEMAMLRPVSPSMGMMLESTSERLLRKGQAHFRCPDKIPARRLATLEAAGRLRVPFTTGILIGIGETKEERIETLEAIADVARRTGAIQEVIVQNFRAKPGTLMEGAPEPSVEEMCETIAAARRILPEEVSVQAPPNLMPGEYGRYLEAGLNDWGGISPVTIDHINPEAAWPKVAELAEVTRSHGFELAERLTVYPRYLNETWIDPALLPRVRAMADERGLAREQVLA